MLGASFDPPEANRAFREKHGWPFPLLCDTEKRLALAYGAARSPEKARASRITVVVGPEGAVERVYGSVNPFDHADRVLADLGGAPPAKRKGFLRQLFGK